MRVTELIAELSDARSKYGDVEVVVDVYDGKESGRFAVTDASLWPGQSGKMECVLECEER